MPEHKEYAYIDAENKKAKEQEGKQKAKVIPPKKYNVGRGILFLILFGWLFGAVIDALEGGSPNTTANFGLALFIGFIVLVTKNELERRRIGIGF